MDAKQICQNIEELLSAELAELKSGDQMERATYAEFVAARVVPAPIPVNFSGGITQTCWSVTQSDDTYSVVYLPNQGYFALCVASDFGPLDIGVHGSALGCFASV